MSFDITVDLPCSLIPVTILLNDLIVCDKKLFETINLKNQHQYHLSSQKSLKATGNGVGVTIMMKPINNSSTTKTTMATVLNKNFSKDKKKKS